MVKKQQQQQQKQNKKPPLSTNARFGGAAVKPARAFQARKDRRPILVSVEYGAVCQWEVGFGEIVPGRQAHWKCRNGACGGGDLKGTAVLFTKSLAR